MTQNKVEDPSPICMSVKAHKFIEWPKKKDKSYTEPYMGVSENSVPLNPMVNDHYPY